MKRLFDIVFSLFGIIFLLPAFVLIAIWIKLDSKGCMLYKQKRVGKEGEEFTLFKFRTMGADSEKKGFLTVGDKDSRITRSGYYLRKFKLDELPQLFNVLIGDMSFVGPRPEVKKYTDLYNEKQKRVLNVRPGITDPASLEYINESEELAKQEDPEAYYINVIMPRKLNINIKYLNGRTFFSDIGVIFKTVSKVFRQ